MLGKLLKHEFVATGRAMWIIYAAMVVMSLFANISIRLLDRPDVPQFITALMVMILVLWVLMLVFAVAATFVLMLRRFQKNLLTDEGYLMFTLPANVHELVIAKLIAATVWLLVTFAMIALCVLAAVASTEVIREAFEFLQSVFESMTAYYAIKGTLVLAECFLMMLLSLAGNCLQVYSAMSIGHGFNDHKVLLSVVFFFVQSFAVSFAANMLTQIIISTGVWQNFDLLDITTVQGWHLSVILILAMELLIGALFYALTVINLKKRLNLS